MLNFDDKELKGYEGIYWINPNGSVNNGRKELKTYTINSGYSCLKLHGRDGVRKSVLVHRLVAENFIPNPKEKREVNHLDGNKQNNSVENLEWSTSKENRKHAMDSGLWEYNVPTKGIKLGKSSKYRGVTYDKSRRKYAATVRYEGKNLEQRKFLTEVEAALHYNYIVIKYSLDRPLNIIE